MSNEIQITQTTNDITVNTTTNTVTVTPEVNEFTIVTTGAIVPTKAEIGLDQVDNTSDANKPISTAAQTALNLKADKANPQLSGTMTLANNMTITGDFSTASNRPKIQSNTGTVTSWRVLPPTDDSLNDARIQYHSTTDLSNTELLAIGARNNPNNPFRIALGTVSSGATQNSTKPLSIVGLADGTIYATVRPGSTPTATTDLTRKDYVDGLVSPKANSVDPSLSGTATLADGFVFTGDLNSRTARPAFQSNTGTVTGVRIIPPAGASADQPNNAAQIAVLSKRDGANTNFLTVQARDNDTTGFRILTGTYVNNVIQQNNQKINFCHSADGSVYAAINPLGAVANTDLTTKSYVDQRVSLSLSESIPTSSDQILEGNTNVYFTAPRARASIAVIDDGGLGSLTYDQLSGNITYTGPSASDVRSQFSAGTGITITDGSIAVDTDTIATQSYVSTQIANLVDSAPAALDTLNELAAALGDDANFATTTATAIGNKLNTADFTSTADTWLGTKDTDDLGEGSTNQYFTQSRARQSISVTDSGGDGSLAYDNSTGVITYTGPSSTEVRAHFTGGTGISITDGSIAVDFTEFDTDDVVEGTTNQYFTQSRARQSISVTDSGGDGSLSYDNSTGVITYNGPSASEVRAHFSAGTGISITDGTIASTITQYTDALARQSISVTDAGGDGSLAYDNSTGVITYTGPSASEVRAHFSAGTGVTITNGSIAIGQSVATSATPSFAGGTFTGAVTIDHSAINRSKRTATGTGSNGVLALNRNRTDAARASAGGPWLAFEYQGTDNTEATSPQNAIRSQYDSGGKNYLELLELAGSYSTGVQTIARFKRGDHYLRNTTGVNSFSQSDTTTSILGQTSSAGFLNVLGLTKRRTDVTAPTDGDKAAFSILFQGNTGSALDVGKFEGTYDATNGHAFSMNVFDTTSTSSVATVSTTQTQTTISARLSGNVGSPAEVAIFNRDNIILGGTTGTTKGSAITYRRTFGCFHKMANVTAAAANTVYAFDWSTDTTAHVNTQGITVSNTSRINFDTGGDYKLGVEMQVKNTDNAERTAYVWLARNGTDISDTMVKLGIRPKGSADQTYYTFYKEWLVDELAANDYLELRFAVDDNSGISLEYNASQTSPYARPASPSAVLTITPVGA